MKLMVATPCYSQQLHTEYLTSWTRTMYHLLQQNVSLNLNTLGNESLITRGRNVLVAQFLQSDSTHLMFIDSDIGWNAEDVYDMLLQDKDVIGGIYPKKKLQWSRLGNDKVFETIEHLRKTLATEKEWDNVMSSLVVEYVVKANEQSDFNKDVTPVDYIGTGFMMIKREVIEKMVKQYSHTKFRYDKNHQNPNEQHLYALFDCKVQDGNYLSEDYLFCKRWRDMGGEVHAYTKAKLKHVGAHVYKG